MDYSAAEKALKFFSPFFSKSHHLNFYGGEPLLAFPLIKKVISFLQYKNKTSDKKSIYSITTNASLLTDEIYRFFNKHKFSVEVSFDGLAQKLQRQKKSTHKVLGNIMKILDYPDIVFEVNSVFTPSTISYLSESTEYLIDLGIPNIRFSLDTIPQWSLKSLRELEKEIVKLRKIVIAHYRKHIVIPVSNFREKLQRGIFCCTAGKGRLAITPNEDVWGCFLFPDFFMGKDNSVDFHKFSFGSLDDFIQNHRRIYPRISSNYSHLSMNNFSTTEKDCLFCSYLENCRVCPINAAFSGYPLGRIPDCLCKIKRIQIEEKKKFQEEIQVIQS